MWQHPFAIWKVNFRAGMQDLSAASGMQACSSRGSSELMNLKVRHALQQHQVKLDRQSWTPRSSINLHMRSVAAQTTTRQETGVHPSGQPARRSRAKFGCAGSCLLAVARSFCSQTLHGAALSPGESGRPHACISCSPTISAKSTTRAYTIWMYTPNCPDITLSWSGCEQAAPGNPWVTFR